MKYNIIVLLKLRKYIFEYYKENKYYKFAAPKTAICDVDSIFDTESKLIFEFLKKYTTPNHVYYIKNICQFNFNILVASYSNQKDVMRILDQNREKCDEYINKNIMSAVLVACKYKDTFFVFSTFLKSKCVKFDKNNETHLELVKYYYKDYINYNRLFFSDDIVKYIKLEGKFKLTKYYPFLVNL